MIRKIAVTSDSDFEQSFFQLAYDSLQQKLNNLIPFLVGFETIKKSDDGTKALGVFGFKSNNGQIIFVPAFFLNGTVKGVDILYSKNNEQFYPLNEDFAELLLKDDATGVGDTSKESDKELRHRIQPTDLQSLVRPPRTGKVSYASVIEYVENEGNLTKQAFYDLFKKHDDFAEACLKFYTPEQIGKALRPKKEKVASVESKVQLVTKKDDLSKIAEEIKEEVYNKGYAFIDKRAEEEKSKLGFFEYTKTLTNPSDNGFYSYLTSTGNLRAGLVITKPMPLSRNYTSGHSIVMDLSKDNLGYCYAVDQSDIFIRRKFKATDFNELHKELLDPAEARPSFNKRYILIDENLNASQPFEVEANFKDGGGIRRIKVHLSGIAAWNEQALPYERRKDSGNSYFTGNLNTRRYDSITLVMTKKSGTQFGYTSDSTVYIPKGFKLLEVDFGGPGYVSRTSQDEEATKAYQAFEEGKPGRLTNALSSMSINSIYPFELYSNGSDYFISVGTLKKKEKDAMSAKAAMVLQFGLDPKAAEEVIDNLPPFVTKKGTIKIAVTGDYNHRVHDISPAYYNVFGQPTYDGHYEVNVQSPDDGYTKDPTRIGLAEMGHINTLDSAVTNARDLANAGQKQIFDTSTIATLAKYVSPENKVHTYMQDFVSCLDKLGRMLFLIYWETDKFEDMYGRSEVPELVELIKNVFKNLGDAIIFLKRKSPELSINIAKDEIGV